MKPNLSTADEVVESEDIAIPHHEIQLPTPFNVCEQKLLLKCGVFSTICTQNQIKTKMSICMVFPISLTPET